MSIRWVNLQQYEFVCPYAMFLREESMNLKGDEY